jgi:hypothetical protein
MISFGYRKHKQKKLTFTWQPFGTQILLWVKIYLDPTIRWRKLNKINVHKYIIYSFSTTIGPHVRGS